MPAVKVNDITIYCEIHGAGAPVVLIAGLNSDHTLYRRMLPQLAARYQVVVFDNRGVGQTDKPDIPYSIDMMAEDTAGLLTALGVERAHILGTSMGGRIAAALALRYPHRVASLILISTVLQSLRGVRMPWSRRLMLLLLRVPPIRGPHPYYAVARQREATVAYDCMDRLQEIQAPTLILHGKDDTIAPYRLACAMHRGIQGSIMRTYPGGHLFFIRRPAPVLAAITAFLDSIPLTSSGRSG
jgi:pimeloyl-ACP methyl ester carboxylesterase